MARPRCRKCGRVRLAPSVQVWFSPSTSSARFRGLLTCGSVWECPVCAAAIKAGRALEVQAALEWHGGPAGMLTLTVRHSWGAPLRALRRSVARCWRRVCSGAPWKRWKARIGLVGSVRALEVTHGPNGWHPHLHVLLFTEHELGASDVAWLRERWRAAVVAELGPDGEPSEERGTTWTKASAAAYLSKLGLEVTDDFDKGAKGANRNPWRIAADYARTRDARELALWREYADGMKGARQLTWSQGLRRLVFRREGEPTDAELAMLAPDDSEHVLTLDPATWRDVVRRGATLEVLEGVEAMFTRARPSSPRSPPARPSRAA